ncbi:MAG: beta-ketoacyl-[Parasporobacterium sp.]|nr:beta-ketoacyl-[acyl-carrier-protein] synthase family protein [Parasporobacterium sp.]
MNRMEKRKIVITGMGAVTPVGIGVSAYWNSLTEGACGIDEIRGLDVSDLTVRRAGQVKDFNPKEFLSMKLVQDLEPYMQYAYVSALEAVAQSGLNTDSSRVGIVMGSALSGICIIGETNQQLALNQKAAGPKFLTKAMGNIAAAQFSINHKIKGPSLTVSTACSSGGDAITIASMLIRSGAADAMIVMAGEAAICKPLIQSLTKTGALSKTGESRPFDKDRNGFVLGEGGGALVLESEDTATARGARVIARLLGCANNTDAFNPVSPDPSGSGAADCMKLALADAGISADEIDYINAHGTATKMGDIAESNAVRMVFGERPVLISSTKGITGHMMGAGGITELIACVKIMETGIIPPNVGFSEADPECAVNVPKDRLEGQTIRAAMSNALGFGGQNSCIIVGRV